VVAEMMHLPLDFLAENINKNASALYSSNYRRGLTTVLDLLLLLPYH